MRMVDLLLVTMLAWSGTAAKAAGSGARSAPVAADGLIQFEPPQAVSCVAVRVVVPEDQMLTGIRWRNGTSAASFPRVLVASGSGSIPPRYDQAVTVAQAVQGVEQDWSDLPFTVPVASQSGTLFVLLEYPANYAPPAEGVALGVGYVSDSSPYRYFVTGNGEEWTKVVSNCRVLLEPVLATREPGVVALRGPQSPQPVEVEPSLGLFAAPNPFNPQTRVDLNLPAATTGTVKVFDIRGYLLADLHQGPLAKGRNTFTWQGRDVSGRAVASGVYWVIAQTTDQKLAKKLLLIK